VIVLLTALLVPMFALALQSEKRAELANEKSILFSQEMASSSSHSNNDIPLATSGTRSATLFLVWILFLRTSLLHLSLPRLAIILMLIGSPRFAQERT
jgi:hypothetical protein